MAAEIILDASAKIVSIMPKAIQLLRRHSSWSVELPQQLPGELTQFLRACQSSRKNSSLAKQGLPDFELGGLRVHANFRKRGAISLQLFEKSPSKKRKGALALNHGMTEREREVCHWLVEGKTNLEIAGILFISPRTVEKHVKAVLDKLGVENRSAATAKMMRTEYRASPRPAAR